MLCFIEVFSTKGQWIALWSMFHITIHLYTLILGGISQNTSLKYEKGGWFYETVSLRFFDGALSQKDL